MSSPRAPYEPTRNFTPQAVYAEIAQSGLARARAELAASAERAAVESITPNPGEEPCSNPD